MSTYRPLIALSAHKHQIEEELLAGVIHVESGGNPLAIRYEPDFYRRYIAMKRKADIPGYWPKTVTYDTEAMLRCCSIGLTQVMGQRAREEGYDKENLLGLTDPATSIELGAKILGELLRKFETKFNALNAYNGGSDPNYAHRVLDAIDTRAIDYLL